MTLDLTKPMQTRDGRKARLLASDLKSQFQLVFVITDKDGNEHVGERYADGRYSSGYDRPHDIINVPEPPKVHVEYRNCYQRGVLNYYGYPSRVEADKEAGPNRIACIRITWTEGQFDE
ncbi:MAG: hypothetical protein KGL39_48170 [Patescibacteria group bacterium]|nr:hypothetical protein [Patescibacteria group bacterium]